jgi:electron transfer flavoprotein beta subunit
MKIGVCLKQILDPNIIEYDINNESLTSARAILNSSDFSALEEALKIKSKHGGEVVAISIGKKHDTEVLRSALMYGADRAVRGWRESLDEKSDTWVVSLMLQNVIKKENLDIIFCGDRSQDTNGQFMGAALASSMNLPFVPRVIGIDIDKNNTCLAHKKLEKGKRETYSFKLPAVLALDENIATPRYVAKYSRVYNQGIKKYIEEYELGASEVNDEPLIERLDVLQKKSRVKMGSKVSGVSVMAMMKVLRGESKGKKELIVGSPQESAEKILKKIKEWY